MFVLQTKDFKVLLAHITHITHISPFCLILSEIFWTLHSNRWKKNPRRHGANEVQVKTAEQNGNRIADSVQEKHTIPTNPRKEKWEKPPVDPRIQHCGRADGGENDWPASRDIKLFRGELEWVDRGACWPRWRREERSSFVGGRLWRSAPSTHFFFLALVPLLGNANCVHQGSFLCDTTGRGRRQGCKCQVSRVVLFFLIFFSPAAPLNKHSLATARGNGGAYLRGKRVAQTAGGIIRTG